MKFSFLNFALVYRIEKLAILLLLLSIITKKALVIFLIYFLLEVLTKPLNKIKILVFLLNLLRVYERF